MIRYQKVISLIKQKEAIKESIINPSLKWQERMSLYAQVRLINEQIEDLQLCNSNFKGDFDKKSKMIGG